MLLTIISFKAFLLISGCIIAIMAISSNGDSKCQHDWVLSDTSTIHRSNGARRLTSYSYRCSKCGTKKKTIM